MEELSAGDVQAALNGWLEPMGLVEVSRDKPDGRITGWIMHPLFLGVSHAERQKWLWEGFEGTDLLKQWQGLRGTFKGRSTQIGLILTYSPAEYENALGQSA
jgi:hypothetical protein